jgi:hypothetical protein
MLQLVQGKRWDISYRKFLPQPQAQVANGEIVKTVHVCPRCVELRCGAITMLETANGTLIERGELTGYDTHILAEAVMSYSVKHDLPCINHDGVV